MERFSRSIRGYEINEVNEFLDSIIGQVEKIIEDNKKREMLFQDNMKEMKSLRSENSLLKDKLETYKRMEGTLQSAIIMAQRTSEEMKMNAVKEAEIVVDNAKQNANRIVNESLVRASQIEQEASILKKNIIVYKNKLKNIIQTQLDLIDDIERVDF